MPQLNPELTSNLNMQSFNLEFCGTKINIRSEHTFNLDNIYELGKTVTGMSMQDDAISECEADLTFIPHDDTEINYDESNKRMMLYGPLKHFGSGKAIIYTAGYIAECLRAAKQGPMLIHSAAVQSSKDSGSIVLLGEKGAGKTTLALRLCHEFGHRLIGNDNVFLGSNSDSKLITMGGNAWFDVRSTAVSADKYLEKIVDDFDSQEPAWNKKVRIEPEDVDIDVCSEESLVRSIYHIRIDHSQDMIYTNEWSGMQRHLLLHERFGRHITGQATPFQDDQGNYLGSLPSVNLSEAILGRDALVKQVVNHGITEIFAPNSSEALNYIIESDVSL